MRVLVIDHRDSFTFNLVSYLEDLIGRRPVVVNHDEDLSIEFIAGFDAVIFSPGPGRADNPDDIGNTLNIIRLADVPMLGVCLGHQALAQAWGGGTELAPEPVHGQTVWAYHDGIGLFAGLKSPLEVVRYHSLIADPIPDSMVVTARTADGIPMALAHKELPQWGVQFHPESVGGFDGHRLLQNFLGMAARRGGVQLQLRQAQPVPAPPKPKPRWYANLLTIEHAVDTAELYCTLFAHSYTSFWLDASNNAHPDGRYSYLGDTTGPYAMTMMHNVGRGDALDQLDRVLQTDVGDTSALDHLDLGFKLGWVGYLGYELKAECGADRAHTSPYSDMSLLFADRALAVDHHNNKVHLMWLTGADEISNQEQQQWVAEVVEAMFTGEDDMPPLDEPIRVSRLKARATREHYLDDINRCIDKIYTGDSYEICLTNRLVARGSIDVVAAYLQLRAENPSPFGALLRFGDLAVMSSSPERFLKVDTSGLIESRPIKGTRIRGGTEVEDEIFREDLATNPKDRAENLMIVDLVRNDLAHVAQPGSVQAYPLFAVETFATVHQLVSTITAQLRGDKTLVDLIRASFPGGSMTGAPKIRTMQIIDNIEGQARGIYSGALGYFGIDGAMDLSMVIRSIIVDGDFLSYGVGGAILAISDPETEYQEIITKTAPLLNLVDQEFPTEQ